MKNRIILTMILAVTAVSGLLAGCGAKNASEKEISAAKAEKLSIADNTSKKDESITDILTVRVLADYGWDADSTPAILHIEEKKADGSEFYHAISPDADGGKGSASIKLAKGDYTVEFVSPLNNDGSAYEIDDMGSAQEIIVGIDNKDLTLDCEMKQIPAEQVSDEMIREIETKIQAAVEKGDETLKGDPGKAILEALAVNMKNSLNATKETRELMQTVKRDTNADFIPTEETKVDNIGVTAEKIEEKQDNRTQSNQIKENTVQSNNVQNNPAQNIPVQENPVQNTPVQNDTTQNNNNQTITQPSVPAKPEKPEKPAHVHTWADHVVTTQIWIPNLVTVPDYETKEVVYWHCTSEGYDEEGNDIGAHCGMEFPDETEEDQKRLEEHIIAHILAGELSNGYNFLKTETVQIGSHTEDQGHYETQTSVDYVYCTGCGEKQ